MLDICQLRVAFGGKEVLSGVDISLKQGDSLAIVGESGVGKTTLGLSIAGLVQGDVQGKILFHGENLLQMPEQELNRLRWNRISLVLQNDKEVLNPVMPVIKQVMEPMVEHGIAGKKQAREQAAQLLTRVGLEPSRHDAYSHQLSGGERQRAMIAMALANAPELIILDEPTASLDALTRVEIIKLLRGLKKKQALLVITHDLSSAAKLGNEVAVLYGGKLVEKGPVKSVLGAPRHPYTRGLLRSYPNMTTVKDLQGIKGRLQVPAEGCCFHPRCTQAVDICRQEHPPWAGEKGHYLACHRGGIVPLLEGKGLHVQYGPVRAVKGVNLEVYEGETLALVGESGSGKSSLAYSLMGITGPVSGEVYLDGKKTGKRDKEFFRRVQMVFQNPGDSISHRHNVLQAVREPLDVQNLGCDGERREKVRRALDEVQLPSDDDFLAQYPHHLSGGEVQRVAMARALVLQPAVIVADEPTSALDASVQAKILKLLLDLQQNRGLGILFITHDIALARKFSDRMAVMLAGSIVEEGPAEQVVSSPLHPYTRDLLDAAPDLDYMEEEDGEAGVKDPGPGEAVPARGCPFVSRCRFREQKCLVQLPQLAAAGRVKVACHRFHSSEKAENGGAVGESAV